MDDGSKDGTVEEVKKLAGKDNRVKMVSFSRNFGKEAAELKLEYPVKRVVLSNQKEVQRLL